MGTLYIQTTGSTTNSGSTDQDAANLSGSAATSSGTTVSLDGSPDLSGLITSGATQSSIYIAQATNTNKRIFWITAFDNSAKTVTVDTAPSGVTSSAWAIGGRFHLGSTGSPANASIEGALRAGDEVVINDSPLPQAASIWTFRIAGDSTSGFAKVRGKTGVRPVFNTTNTSNCVSFNSLAYCWLENVEVDQDGASGAGVSMNGANGVCVNVKVSDAGGAGFSVGSSAGTKLWACEATGCGADGFTIASSIVVFGCISRGNVGDGFEITSTNGYFLVNNIAYDNGGSGFNISSTIAAAGTSIFALFGNVSYSNDTHGLVVADQDSPVVLFNNIFSNNGTTSGEYNVLWSAGAAERQGFHGYNIFHQGGAADNLSGITANSTELTTDPVFTNAAAGDFSIGSSSPAKAAGYPGAFLGALSTGYMDIGAVQRQESTGSSTAHHSNLTRGLA